MNVTEYANTTERDHDVQREHAPVDVVLALRDSEQESTRWRLHETTSFNAGRFDADFVAENRAGRELCGASATR